MPVSNPDLRVFQTITMVRALAIIFLQLQVKPNYFNKHHLFASIK